ncbi:uroporphyrinogen-III synthase [Microbacter margulisiae]|uniref:Uroporphyrinogen-III synthase n=1 Tax=Microbacter margulisiae TaxID=1350067 RepID=A0A7W5DNI2_9PORP|nr:uroporphyrinogen-III synthase [Microbacter margulisiae]MBB3186116.1 uroporphyrinogen-III synthase [Microbacter margulisiae]
MRPLSGKIVILTQPLADDDSLSSHLEQVGAEIIRYPLIEIMPTRESPEKHSVFSQIASYTYIIFTSKNGVSYFFEYAAGSNTRKDIREEVRYAAIGNKTAAELQKYGIQASYVSRGNTSEDFVQELLQQNITGQEILLPLGTLAPDTLEQSLSSYNVVTRLNVYETRYVSIIPPEIIARIEGNRYDLIIFTSPSAIESFMHFMQQAGIRGDFRMACIGKTTARKATEMGIQPLLVSSKPDGAVFAKEIYSYLSTL